MEALIDNAIEAAAGAFNATLSLPSSVFLGQYNQRDTYRIEDSCFMCYHNKRGYC